VLQLCPCVQFLFQKLFSNTIFPELVEKTKETYVLPLLNDYSCIITNFDLWMSKGARDVFILVIIFLGSNWKPKHVTLGLVEAVETIRHVMIRNIIELLDAYGLRNKIITYVKDEGSNVNTLINALKFVVKCETLGLDESFQGTCFGHVFPKACQYTTTNDKVCKNLKYVFIKSTYANLQKCITWPKKFGKCHKKWKRACIEASLRPKKLNTLVKTQLVWFLDI
jgi:hypothetical protein